MDEFRRQPEVRQNTELFRSEEWDLRSRNPAQPLRLTKHALDRLEALYKMGPLPDGNATIGDINYTSASSTASATLNALIMSAEPSLNSILLNASLSMDTSGRRDFLVSIRKEMDRLLREITLLEANCTQGYSRLDEWDSRSQTGTSAHLGASLANDQAAVPRPEKSFSSDLWSQLYRHQVELLQAYYDIMFLAHHPASEGSGAADFVKANKIPLRLWNRGVFRFLERLRMSLPDTAPLAIQYIEHCYSLLSMMVEPMYDSRHMWLEALGDTARFALAMGSSETVNWERVALYWYLRASVRSPGVGRLYHHCAVVSYDFDSLFFCCKSLLAYQPFAPSRDALRQLFEFMREKQKSSEQANSGSSAIMFLHQSALLNGLAGSRTCPSPVPVLSRAQMDIYIGHIAQVHANGPLGKARSRIHYFPRVEAVASCNICALLGYGDKSNVFFKALYRNFVSRNQKFRQDDLLQADDTVYPTREVLYFCFKLLRLYLMIPLEEGLPHIMLWLHFFVPITHYRIELSTVFLNEDFPHDTLVEVLNKVHADLGDQFHREGQREVAQRQRDDPKSSHAPPFMFDVPRAIEIIRTGRYDPTEVQKASGTWSMFRTKNNPALRNRPLPEEKLALGFIWSHDRLYADPKSVQDFELGDYDEHLPDAVDQDNLHLHRMIRCVEVALLLTKYNSWLGYVDGKFFFNRAFA